MQSWISSMCPDLSGARSKCDVWLFSGLCETHTIHFSFIHEMLPAAMRGGVASSICALTSSVGSIQYKLHHTWPAWTDQQVCFHTLMVHLGALGFFYLSNKLNQQQKAGVYKLIKWFKSTVTNIIFIHVFMFRVNLTVYFSIKSFEGK